MQVTKITSPAETKAPVAHRLTDKQLYDEINYHRAEKVTKKMLEKAGIDYRVVYADEKEGASFAERHSIIQAPTLLMPEEDSYRKLTNIGEISGYLKKQPVA